MPRTTYPIPGKPPQTRGRANPEKQQRFRRYVLTGKHLREDRSIKSHKEIAADVGVLPETVRRWFIGFFPELVEDRKPFHLVQDERKRKREKFRCMIREGKDRDEYGRRLSTEALARTVGVSYWTLRSWMQADFFSLATARRV